MQEHPIITKVGIVLVNKGTGRKGTEIVLRIGQKATFATIRSTMSLILVDCEATGKSPSTGYLTEFGAISYTKRETFHGELYAITRNADHKTVGAPKDHPEKVFLVF